MMENEKRLIDANAIPKLFERKYEETEQRILAGETYLDSLAEGFTEADDVILAMPTVDAVEVVRCKDCANYCGFEHCKNGICDVDSVSKRAVYPDDFCSYGERKSSP